MQSEPTVFIVDDEKAVRESVAALLRAHKLHVELFASAEEFLNVCDGASSGCLIADMRLDGGMNGVQLQQALADRGDKLPVIMISGHVDERAAQNALDKGACCVLQKPVPYKELLGHVRRALEIDAERRKR
jgi:FixJ family two-component response regulator